MTVDVGSLADVPIGGSIAINGVCLTAVDVEGTSVTVDVVAETLARSNVGDLNAGDPVNVERPTSVSGLLDGHIVQGHVDGVGVVASLERDGRGGGVLTVDVPSTLSRYIVEKGSIAIDGISLTVAAISGDRLRIAVIPHTMEMTNVGSRREGDRVNVEVDVLAKYVEKLLRHYG